ncbi:hypothetical protein [cf. Phormidesmis sp. LEGE 11477]|uniref:hypothetical protein n=1 Tax=cf. Phormidesmis sp. LEGE 11477 TaxID=1828680 RepID=UPI00187F44E5|nr:hypothetical protein [cf. Phormidesmis sp. LEGE 11477]MBE9063423.1 hypothetical protein [cf. Phormidesmis sp. LEGE 11477]
MLLATSNTEEFMISAIIYLSYVAAILGVLIGALLEIRFVPYLSRAYRALLYFFMMMGAILLLHYQIVPFWVSATLFMISAIAPIALERNVDWFPELLSRLEEIENDKLEED